MKTQNKFLDDSYWSERYQSQKIGWDIGEASTPISEYINQIEDKSILVLIPGCGNAYEAKLLLDIGFTNVTLIDISETLINALKVELKTHTAQGNCTLIHGDFFDLQESFDLIIEQTFFCALDPDLRASYVEKMYDLLNPDGKIVGLMFNRSFEEGPNAGNPPFGGSVTEYRGLFEPKFKIEKLEEAYNSIPSRQGSEVFVKFRKQKKTTNNF